MQLLNLSCFLRNDKPVYTTNSTLSNSRIEKAEILPLRFLIPNQKGAAFTAPFLGFIGLCSGQIYISRSISSAGLPDRGRGELRRENP